MKSETIDWISEHLPEGAVVFDEYDDCIVGTVERFGMDPVVLYDRGKILEKLVSEDGMSDEEAVEHFEFNILGGWMGDGTPCFSSGFVLP